MKLTHLRVNHQKTPFVDSAPEFSWQIESEKNNVLQTAFEISVCDKNGEVWNSGKIESRQQSFVRYCGNLHSKTRYDLTVTVWDNNGSNATESSFFETAFLSADDWSGCFVKSPFERNEPKLFTYGVENPAVFFERDFNVTDTVKSARLYATAYGVYQPALNGRRFGGELAPEYTPYNKILNYQCYDITELLKTGDNRLDFLIGDGWFFCPQTEIATDEKIDNLSILYQLEIEYADGKKDIIFSDGSEKCRKSDIVFSDLFMGEKVDRTLTDGEIKNAVPAEFSLEKLRTQPMPQIKAVEEIKAENIYISPKGEIIVDFGQVIAGKCKISVTEPKGAELKFEYTEIVDRDGNYFSTMDLVKQTDVFISNGIPDIFETTFTFHGFRYIRVSGMTDPKKEDFTAYILSTEKENIGSFVCSDERFNRLYKNIRYSQKNNMMSIPTDCPSREKAGWTGDILIYAKTAMQNEEMTPFLSSWLLGLAADQQKNGVVPLTSPFNKLYYAVAMQTMAPFGDSEPTGIAGWSDAILWVPYDMYKMTGNIMILGQFYDNMKKWCDYVIRTAEEKRGSKLPYEYDRYLWNTGFHFGEWLVPGRTAEGFEICKETSCYIAPFFGYMTLKKMSEIAELFNSEDARYYKDYSEKFKNAIQNGLMKSDILPDYLQGLYVLAIAFNLVPGEMYDEYASQLVRLIEEKGKTLCTGFLATPYLLDALVKIGRKDIAKDILWQNRRPSWLFEVENGATSIWENWFALDEDRNPDKTSFDHYAFGVIDDFIFRRICGISSDSGFYHISIAPETDWGFDGIKRTFICESGEISVSYSKEKLNVKIPCNTTATVEWKGKKHEIGSGTYSF